MIQIILWITTVFDNFDRKPKISSILSGTCVNIMALNAPFILNKSYSFQTGPFPRMFSHKNDLKIVYFSVKLALAHAFKHSNFVCRHYFNADS